MIWNFLKGLVTSRHSNIRISPFLCKGEELSDSNLCPPIRREVIRGIVQPSQNEIHPIQSKIWL